MIFAGGGGGAVAAVGQAGVTPFLFLPRLSLLALNSQSELSLGALFLPSLSHALTATEMTIQEADGWS